MKNTIVLILSFSFILSACGGKEYDPLYRENMRTFVGEISVYSKNAHPGFIIIPQNGHELVSIGGEGENDPHLEYLSSIDGAGQEDLFYGYSNDDRRTPELETEFMLRLLNICEANGVEVLVTDYCTSSDHIQSSYSENADNGFISFAAPERELSIIPNSTSIYNDNNADIHDLSDAKNFLYLINPEKYQSKEAMVEALEETKYDLLIIDFFYEEQQLTQSDISRLKHKYNGGERLVIAYMSIGEAEEYRYYWEESWEDNPPEWLLEENRQWEGNYKVNYWDSAWKQIIYGAESSYLDMILEAGFDGVYLDIIEAFEYFE